MKTKLCSLLILGLLAGGCTSAPVTAPVAPSLYINVDGVKRVLLPMPLETMVHTGDDVVFRRSGDLIAAKVGEQRGPGVFRIVGGRGLELLTASNYVGRTFPASVGTSK